MDGPEVSVALSISIVSVAIAFTLFIIFFDPWTARPRPFYKGFWQRLFRSIKTYGRKMLIGIAAIAIAAALAILIVKFGGRIISQIHVGKPKSESAVQVSVDTKEEAKSAPVETQKTSPISDHTTVNYVRLDQIPAQFIEQAKSTLHVLFVHGSFGSQITLGMKSLVDYKGSLYEGLDLKELYIGDDQEYPPIDSWEDHARSFLDDPANRTVNVVIWSWRDLLTIATESDVDRYLQIMVELEKAHPDITFVYMTGHVDGKGLEGNTHLRNEQIRSFCKENNKVLYDFADIESYDPDGNYYLDKRVNEGCWYDSDGDFSLETNWAKEWIKNNPDQWYECTSPHTHPLNANLKAYAAWWLWARLAGWNGQSKD